ncbi:MULTISPECIES: GntR family transcriptional regulator [unclassified Sinorhizobium]|uniref:GntR family transcriptional regulator n=1 Tax=unclassified Sinorhizobium TaxID=2613772 RepID=UPI003523471B
MFDVQYQTNSADERPWADRFKTAQTYGRLKHLLVFQKIPPRTRLDIGVLARRLNVSKTPVREALIMLAEERIIQAVPGSGYFSKPLNATEIAEDYEVAFAMLKHTIEASVQSFSKSGLTMPKTGPLVALGQELTHNVRPYADFIEALFERVAAMKGNQLSLQMVHAFNGRTTFIRQLDLEQPGHFEEIATAMSEFVECLERWDAPGAVANLERQYKRKIDLLHHLVAQGNLRAMNVSEHW